MTQSRNIGLIKGEIMRTKVVAAIGLLFLPVVALACPKGQAEYEKVCVIELKSLDEAKGDNTSWVSDEKPPKTTTGEWQTGKFKVYYLPSQDAKTETDDQIRFAQNRDGQKP
jgi:hypothetical protein